MNLYKVTFDKTMDSIARDAENYETSSDRLSITMSEEKRLPTHILAKSTEEAYESVKSLNLKHHFLSYMNKIEQGVKVL